MKMMLLIIWAYHSGLSYQMVPADMCEKIKQEIISTPEGQGGIRLNAVCVNE